MKERILKLFIQTGGLLALLFAYFLANKFIGFSIPCPIHLLTGYYCPGCGITRCLFSIIKLDFVSAFWYNPLVFCLLPFFCLYYLYTSYLFIMDKKDNIICKISKLCSYTLLIIVILFGIIRNLNGFEFLLP